MIGFVKYRGKYNHDIREDSNLDKIIEAGKELLEDDHEFKSPFSMDDFPFPIEEDFPNQEGTKEPLRDFILPDSFSDDVKKITKGIKMRPTGIYKRVLIVVLLLLLVFALFCPFCRITKMWNEGHLYKTIDFDLTFQQVDSSDVVQNNLAIMNNALTVSKQGAIDSKDEVSHFNNHQQIIQGGSNGKGADRYHFVDGLLSYDWFIILLGVILTLSILTIIILLVFSLRKCCELEHEERKVSFDRQSKLIGEYYSHIYASFRLEVQKRESDYELEKQAYLLRLERIQHLMNIQQKEQENAWKYKMEHLKVVEESFKTLTDSYLKNWRDDVR